MKATASKDLYAGPLKEPEFLEATPTETDSSSVKSRGKNWILGATLAASSFFLVVPLASSSAEVPAPVVVSEGTYVVPEIAEWKRWLRGLADTDLNAAVLARLNRAFEELIEPTGFLPGGMAPSPDVYLLTWDFDEHHLELELFADHWEWFYKNRKTGRLAGEEDLVATSFGKFRKQIGKYAS